MLYLFTTLVQVTLYKMRPKKKIYAGMQDHAIPTRIALQCVAVMAIAFPAWLILLARIWVLLVAVAMLDAVGVQERRIIFGSK